MVSWRLRRHIRRVNARIKQRIEQAQGWQDPMSPLPLPEPPPIPSYWTFGWSWEIEPWWYYIFPPQIDESMDTNDSEDASPLVPDNLWAQLVDNFVCEFNPAEIMRFVFGPHDRYLQTLRDRHKSVSIHLCDPRSHWQRLCT